MVQKQTSYPAANLEIDYPPTLSRLTTFFRLILVIPVLFLLQVVGSTGASSYMQESGNEIVASTGGIIVGLFFATLLMILFRKKYPRWWFDFNLELNRFSTRVGAYMMLLTDKYPSTTDEQTVHLDIAYPDARNDLNRGLPIVKWILALPHYVVLFILSVGLLFTTIFAWFAILLTGRYPRPLFDFAVGVARWSMRVTAYATLLTTDKYPPFTLDR